MQCKFIKSGGKQCQGYALQGDQHCFWHSENVAEEEKRMARALGGKTHKIKVDTPLDPLKIKDKKDVVVMLEDTINRVRSGEMELKIANCLGYLSGHILKALEQSDLEKRLEELEEMAIRN
jgi:hypothetical protein